MKALTKKDMTERDAIASRLQDRQADLTQAIEEFTLAVETAWGAVEVAQDQLNEAIHDANEWRHAIAAEIGEYIDERSDKWRESDKGSAYELWRERYEGEFNEVEIDKPELPDPDLDEFAEELWQLPEELEA